MSGFETARLPWLVTPTGRPVGVKEVDGDETFVPTISADGLSLIKPDGTAFVGTGVAYVLPAATGATLGGIKAGSGISIAADGTASASGGGGGSAVTDIPFSAAVPLTNTAGAYMAAKTVSAALTLTPAANAVRGALVYLRLIADGTNLPDYSAFKEWGGSMGYDNRAGIENQMQFFFDGFNYFVSISQAVGAIPVPSAATGVTMTGPTSGVVSTASSAFTVGVTPVGGAITGSIVVTPTPVAGVVFAPSSVTLNSGTPTGTFTATPSATGNFSVSVTNNGGLTNPSALTYTVAASATVPNTPPAPAATSAINSAGITLTAPTSDGGAAINGYTVASNPAGGVDSAAGTTSLSRTITGLTAGTNYTFTFVATNAVGNSAASPASNTVTPTAPVVTQPQYPRAAGVSGETGTGPYSYAAGQAEYTTRLTTPTLPGDGYFILRQEAYSAMWIGLHNSATPSYAASNTAYPPNTEYSLSSATGHWVPCQQAAPSGVLTPTVDTGGIDNSGVPANGNWVRMMRVGTTVTAAVSKDQGSTWTTVYSWTGVTGTLYPELACKVAFTLMGGSGLV